MSEEYCEELSDTAAELLPEGRAVGEVLGETDAADEEEKEELQEPELLCSQDAVAKPDWLPEREMEALPEEQML